MTDAQKALDAIKSSLIDMRLVKMPPNKQIIWSQGTTDLPYIAVADLIVAEKALRLLAAVEAGTHKVVPINSVRCKECDDTQRRNDNGEICNCIF